VKFCVAPPAIVALAGLAAVQVAVPGLVVGVTDVTLALVPPLFLRARVRVTAWPTLAVVGEAVSVGASTAAACTVTEAPVTVGLMLAPLTESVAATVAP
jgi:NAD/NADP transhydrogenase beta subunit